MALEDSDELWELDRGHLPSKAGGTVEHNHVVSALHHRLVLELNHCDIAVSANAGRLRIAARTYFVPDLYVIPRGFVEQKLRETQGHLEVYDEQMPLVVEVWSPSTGYYDVEEKLREYQRRGDLEIWRIHPSERTLTAWRRQADGTYSETLYQSGSVRPVALAGVTIDLEGLFS